VNEERKIVMVVERKGDSSRQKRIAKKRESLRKKKTREIVALSIRRRPMDG